MGMGGFGEMFPYHENKITLDKNKKDKWGLNVLAFDGELKENELKMRKDMKDDAIEMLTVAGVKNVKVLMVMVHLAAVFMKWVQRAWAQIQKHLC